MSALARKVGSLLFASALIVAAGGARAVAGEEDADPNAPRDVPSPPSPPGPVDFEIAASGGYLSTPIRGATTPFGLGLGGRAGLTFYDVYVGATFTSYFGGKDVDLTDRSMMGGVELGYDLHLVRFTRGHFSLRPVFGLGDAAVSHSDPSLAKVDVVTSSSGRSSTSTSSDTITVNTLYLQPSLYAILTSDGRFVALSGCALVLPRVAYGDASEPATWLSYGFQAQLGFRL